MLTHNLGYPRIGGQRELKKACEIYWSGKSTMETLIQVGKSIRRANWDVQKEKGIDLIPSNDFSFYDHVLDMSLTVNAIPARFRDVILNKENSELDIYFAMARGYQRDGLDITAMEMTKWFDTNYHYIVPEFHEDQQFNLLSTKIIDEFYEARELGITTKPVLIGPVSYLLLGKEKEKGFSRVDLVRNLLPVYLEVLRRLDKLNVEWVQFDEPFLALDLDDRSKKALHMVYGEIRKEFPSLKTILATYFDGPRDNLQVATSLPVYALHVDLVRVPQQLDELIRTAPQKMSVSLGVVDGRNIWKNDYAKSLKLIKRAVEVLGESRVLIAPSCSLIHSPVDLDLESNDDVLTHEIKNWMAFAKQKLHEVEALRKLGSADSRAQQDELLAANQKAVDSRRTSSLIHKESVAARVRLISEADEHRHSGFSIRQPLQSKALNLPLFPTTSIGSFPQTDEVRSWRAKWRKGELTDEAYENLVKAETKKAVQWQDEIGIDVPVHGEFERNDMVEYFGEQLEGFAFSKNGWVQSYGSRCVKPPIIFGDISRPKPITVRWTAYAQSLTNNPMKGMLTGPVTIQQWSFVRDDQPRKDTCLQIALAIRDEVLDLEKAGIRVIQIDEPAIREGLPLRKADWSEYLSWAVRAFRISASGVRDETQIHTHMCYSEFNDIIQSIADMDADVITIETSRSQMELLDAFVEFRYPNGVGPGVYDIHSPRVPTTQEMVNLLDKALRVLPPKNLWVNPDCGLKTRKWKETDAAMRNMIEAARQLRQVAETLAE